MNDPGLVDDRERSGNWIDVADGEEAEIREAMDRVTQSRQFRALRDDVRAGRVAAFVGPGVSQGAGLSGPESVINTLAMKLAHRFAIDREPAEVERLRHLGLYALGDLFIHSFGLPQFTQAVTEALYEKCSFGEEDLDLHGMILQVPFAMIVSTNWDDLFEQAGRQLDPRICLNAITTDNDLLGLFAQQKPMLIQPRGSLRKVDAIVSENVTWAHDVQRPGLSAFVRSLFFTHKILFIGYGVSDPDLLYFCQQFEPYFTAQGGRAWTRSYVFAAGTAQAGVEQLEQMGLQVIESPVAARDEPHTGTGRPVNLALRYFLRGLLNETRPTVNRVERSRRIADFMGETEHMDQDIRVRAGLSPIGLPEKKQLEDADPRAGFSMVGPYGPHDVEYHQQKRMKDRFLYALDRAVNSGHRVKLILSSNFESIQQRAVYQKWVQLQLQNLYDFFEKGTGNNRLVHVVDRRGSFELQQYIFGDRELVESRKLDVDDRNYYVARTVKDPTEASAAVEMFDVCFQGLAANNIEDLLRLYDDPGRKLLVRQVREALANGAADTVLKTPRPTEPGAARLVDQLRTSVEPSQQEVENLLGSSSPDVIMAVLSEELVFRAIKEHLMAQWRHELEVLGETRPSWIIQVTDAAGESKGGLEKWIYHKTLCRLDSSDVFNLHVAGFALTHDGRRLILRKRRDVGPPFDLGKWDRTVSGHVRKDSSFSREFQTEVVHHFGPLGVRSCSFVTRERFLEECRQRRRQASDQLGSKQGRLRIADVMAFPLHADPISGVYMRHPPGDRDPVFESVRTMLYLCLMPGPELPATDPNKKHFGDWVELDFEQTSKMLAHETHTTCRTVVAGNKVAIGPDTMTDECWRLLRICFDEILSKL